MVKEDTSSKNDEDAGDFSNDTKHNRLIHIKVDKGKQEDPAHFRILGIYTKTYNKWYIDSSSKNGIRILLRVIIMCTQGWLCLTMNLAHTVMSIHWILVGGLNPFMYCVMQKMFMVCVGSWKSIYFLS